MRPLTTKVFGPPKVIARPIVQEGGWDMGSRGLVVFFC